MNPLFPSDDDTTPPPRDEGYLLPGSKKRIEPNPAVELIRHKIDAMYAREPSTTSEINEARTETHRSKHQQFMYELSTSGKSLAQIQTEWHAYYANLPDTEKHEVWQEFYKANERSPSAYTQFVKDHPLKAKTLPTPQELTIAKQEEPPTPVVSAPEPAPLTPPKRRSVADIKKQILRSVESSNSVQQKAKQHLQSLLFGLGMGTLVIVIFLFSFFNEVIIAPFIHPEGTTSSTPIILNTDGVAPSTSPEVIVPKINAELPAVYDNTSMDESVIQKALESGVVHYPTTVLPGQKGNAAFFGHSSNNIFNKGQYKFAFVLLHELVPGDIFYITYNGKIYSYRVYDKKIVNPEDTWVLNPVTDKSATVTLITCDPPGTSLHRLVVWGEQISPDPLTNNTQQLSSQTEPQQLPGNGPTLWGRFWNWLF